MDTLFEKPDCDFNYSRQWHWDSWKVGHKMSDLFGTLHQRYNTITIPIQNAHAFKKDVAEIARDVPPGDKAAFHERLNKRRAERLDELLAQREQLTTKLMWNMKAFALASSPNNRADYVRRSCRFFDVAQSSAFDDLIDFLSTFSETVPPSQHDEVPPSPDSFSSNSEFPEHTQHLMDWEIKNGWWDDVHDYSPVPPDSPMSGSDDVKIPATSEEDRDDDGSAVSSTCESLEPGTASTAYEANLVQEKPRRDDRHGDQDTAFETGVSEGTHQLVQSAPSSPRRSPRHYHLRPRHHSQPAAGTPLPCPITTSAPDNNSDERKGVKPTPRPRPSTLNTTTSRRPQQRQESRQKNKGAMWRAGDSDSEGSHSSESLRQTRASVLRASTAANRVTKSRRAGTSNSPTRRVTE